LSTIGNQLILTGDAISLLISASDANGDALSFSALNLPGFTNLVDNNNGTASLDLIPLASDAGSFNVTVTVSDGLLEDSETFTIEVTKPMVNVAPVLDTINTVFVEAPSQPNDPNIGATKVVRVSISATDANLDDLTFSHSALSINSDLFEHSNITATLELYIEPTDVGTHSVTVSVSDLEFTVSETFAIIVTESPPNVAPALAAIGNQALLQGKITSVLITATDDNGDALDFSVSGFRQFHR